MIGGIERAALAFARGAIALQVTQVRDGCFGAFAGELHEARLHDHAARPESGKAIRGSDDPTNAGTTADAAAVEAPSAGGGRSPHAACQIGCLADLLRERTILADMSKPEFEIILGHDVSSLKSVR
jgi:hypothetical protein